MEGVSARARRVTFIMCVCVCVPYLSSRARGAHRKSAPCLTSMYLTSLYMELFGILTRMVKF